MQDLTIEESYDSLSKKTATFHRWATENVSFMFAFKTDDDIFVRVDRLVSALYQVGLVDLFFLMLSPIGNSLLGKKSHRK